MEKNIQKLSDEMQAWIEDMRNEQSLPLELDEFEEKAREEEIGTEAGTGIKIEGAIARHLPMSQPDSGCPNVGSRILINHLPLL